MEAAALFLLPLHRGCSKVTLHVELHGTYQDRDLRMVACTTFRACANSPLRHVALLTSCTNAAEVHCFTILTRRVIVALGSITLSPRCLKLPRFKFDISVQQRRKYSLQVQTFFQNRWNWYVVVTFSCKWLCKLFKPQTCTRGPCLGSISFEGSIYGREFEFSAISGTSRPADDNILDQPYISIILSRATTFSTRCDYDVHTGRELCATCAARN